MYLLLLHGEDAHGAGLGAALVWGGRTYVPLRSVANLLGAQVDFAGWDSPVEVRTAPAQDYTQEDLPPPGRRGRRAPLPQAG